MAPGLDNDIKDCLRQMHNNSNQATHLHGQAVLQGRQIFLYFFLWTARHHHHVMAPGVDNDIKDSLRQVYEAVRQRIFMVTLPDSDTADFFPLQVQCYLVL